MATSPGSRLTLRSSMMPKPYRSTFVAVILLAAVCVSGTRAQEEMRPQSKGTGVESRTAEELRFANGLMRHREYDLAAREFERILASGIEGAERGQAQYGLANAELYQGHYPQARKAFEQFLEGKPQDSRVLTARYRLGELAYLNGELDEARKSLELFTKSATNHPALETAWTYLGDARFGLSELAGARQAYEKSLDLFPRGRMAGRSQFGLARSLAALGHSELAVPILTKLAQQGGAEWVDRAWLELGSIELSAGHTSEALTAFVALERTAPQSPLRPIAELRQAQTLARLNRKDEAVVLLKKLAISDSETPAARAALELATIELDRKQVDAALATLDRALKRFPKSSQRPALLFRSAEALLKSGRAVDAEARFLEISQNTPTDPRADDALCRAAELALERSDAKQSLERIRALLKGFPDSSLRAQARLIEARGVMADGETKAAIAILEPLIERGEPIAGGRFQVLSEEQLSEGKYQLAIMYRASGQKARAEALLAGIAASANGSLAADAQFLLGQEYVEAGRFGDALPLIKRYLETNPSGTFVDFALADRLVAQLGIGQVDAARQTLAELTTQHPASGVVPASRLRLAEAELSAHRPAQAVDLFRAVANADQAPSQPAATAAANRAAEPSLKRRSLAGLGQALAELGKPSEAATAFESALGSAGEQPGAAELSMLRARALDDSNQEKAALDAYADAARRFPGSRTAQLAVMAEARLLAKLGRHSEAAAAYGRLMDSFKASRNVGDSFLPLDSILAEWGWALIDSDKAADADRVFQRLLDEYPKSPHALDARFHLAESANVVRDYPRVVELLGPLATVKGSSLENESGKRLMPAVLYRFARTQVELKNWKAAGETLDRLMREFANHPYRRESEALRAEVASRQGDIQGAETRLSALLAETPAPTDPPGFVKGLQLDRIQCWVALKRWNEVLDAATKRKAESPPGDPASAELDYAIGQALMGQGKLAEARSAFQAVIDARRTGELAAQAQLMKGEIFYHQEQFREALREFLRVSIMYDAPRWQAVALLEAGKVYERLDQWPDAAETYGRLLSKFPTESAAATARERQAAAVQRSQQATRAKG